MTMTATSCSPVWHCSVVAMVVVVLVLVVVVIVIVVAVVVCVINGQLLLPSTKLRYPPDERLV